MGQILQKWRIPIAVLFSAVLIVGAYVLARGVESPLIAQASTETALLQAIATKDSSGDGLPDWEKTLYGIPANATTTDYFNLGMTDGEAVAKGLIVPKAIADIPVATSTAPLPKDGSLPPPPAAGTLTAAFAQSFFNLFMSAKQANGGGDLTKAQMNDVADQSLASLASAVKAAPDYKSEKDLDVSGSGADVMKAFAVNAETVFLKNTSNATTSEINYLKSALQNDDATALPHIASIAKGYRDTAVGLAALPVPQELAGDDLLLINSMMRLSEIISDFTKVNDDPLAAILALQQYMPAAQALGTAFSNIGATYKSAGISLAPGIPGASFVNLIENAAAKQSARKI